MQTALLITLELLRFGTIIGALVVAVLMSKNWRWWNRLLSGIVCMAIPLGLLVVYQAARDGIVGWKPWWLRGLLASLIVLGSLLLIESPWFQSSAFLSESFVGLVFALSTEAESVSGQAITTTSGNLFEVPGRWGVATFLGAYCAAAGVLFRRNTQTATLVLSWLGFVLAGIASASHYARLIDFSEESLAAYYNTSYAASFFAPIWVAPWGALAALCLMPAGQASEQPVGGQLNLPPIGE